MRIGVRNARIRLRSRFLSARQPGQASLRLLPWLLVLVLPLLLAASNPGLAQAPIEPPIVTELVEQVDLAAITCTLEHLQDDQGTPELDDDGTRFTPTLNATDNVKDIRAQFEAYGLQTEVDTFFPTAEDCATAVKAMRAVCPPDNAFQNVIATLPGEDSSQYYLVTAHYDTIHDQAAGWYLDKETIPAPGANDNGSGVAIMLETARILSGSRFKYDIRFAAFAAEEWGFLGSRRYVAQALQNGDHIAGFINIDMVGLSDTSSPHIYVYYKVDAPDSRALAEAITATNAAYQIMRADLYAESNWMDGLSGRSDQVPFWQAGFTSGVYFGAVKDAANFDVIDPTYHTEGDVLYLPDGSLRLSAAQLQSLAQLTVAAIGSLAQPVEVGQAPPPGCPPDSQQLRDEFNEWLDSARQWLDNKVQLLWQQVRDWLVAQWDILLAKLQTELIRFLEQTWQKLTDQCLGSSLLILLPGMVMWSRISSSRGRKDRP
jgi:hypothetical protein